MSNRFQALVMLNMPDAKYSNERTSDPSDFHTILWNGWSIFISDFGDESIGTVFRDKKLQLSGIEGSNPTEAFNQIITYIHAT